MDSSVDSICKVVLAGDSGVGKTQLIQRFVKGKFTFDQRNTIGIELAQKVVHVGSKAVRVQLWDTGGQERFRCVNAPYFRGALGVVLVYDITSHLSFQSIPYWIDETRQKSDREVEIMLVGNKADLAAMRQVTREEGRTFAENRGIAWVESSAKDGTNVRRFNEANMCKRTNAK